MPHSLWARLLAPMGSRITYALVTPVFIFPAQCSHPNPTLMGPTLYMAPLMSQKYFKLIMSKTKLSSSPTWFFSKLVIWVKHPVVQWWHPGPLPLSHPPIKSSGICLLNLSSFLLLFYPHHPHASPLPHLFGYNHLLVSRHPLWSSPISTREGAPLAILPLVYSSDLSSNATSSRETPSGLSE